MGYIYIIHIIIIITHFLGQLPLDKWNWHDDQWDWQGKRTLKLCKTWKWHFTSNADGSRSQVEWLYL